MIKFSPTPWLHRYTTLCEQMSREPTGTRVLCWGRRRRWSTREWRSDLTWRRGRPSAAANHPTSCLWRQPYCSLAPRRRSHAPAWRHQWGHVIAWRHCQRHVTALWRHQWRGMWWQSCDQDTTGLTTADHSSLKCYHRRHLPTGKDLYKPTDLNELN